MTRFEIQPVSYDYEGAAAASGYSEAILRLAVKAGDLEVRYAVVGGRTLTKPVIERAELARFIAAGKPERARDA